MATVNPLHILIVEDDPFVRETSSWMLEAEGFHVQSAANGHEAWRLLQSTDAEILLTDIHMPGLTGVELADRVANAFPQLPIILTSGAGLPSADWLRRGGCYLPKPYDRASLLKAIYAAANDNEL